MEVRLPLPALRRVSANDPDSEREATRESAERRRVLVAELARELKEMNRRVVPDSALAEAREGYERQRERGAQAERRATTLLGFVSLAVTFVLANGGLLLGTSGIVGIGWRLAFGAALLLVTFSLIVSGLWATRAVHTTHVVIHPYAVAGVRERMRLDEPTARLQLLAALIYGGERGGDVAGAKIDAMKEATLWFRIGLVVLFLLALLFMVYVGWGPST
jgi:hypothetical protein